MIMIESKFVVIYNMLLMKYLTLFDPLILMGITISRKKPQYGLGPFCFGWYTLKDFYPLGKS
jgi:hypothetical protein